MNLGVECMVVCCTTLQLSQRFKICQKLEGKKV